MVIPLDTSRFLELVEKTETVTYYVRTGHGPYAPGSANHAFAPGVPVRFAKRRAVTKQDQEDDALLSVKDVAWHVGRRYLDEAVEGTEGTAGEVVGSIVPKKGDVIEDALGQLFVIMSVDIQSFGNRFRCPTMLANASIASTGGTGGTA